ncbi:G4 quadruplex nucleic acid binding protein [Rhizina undulata]
MSSATISVAPTDNALKLLLASFKELLVSEGEPASITSKLTLASEEVVSGTNTIASHLSTLIRVFAKNSYSAIEQAEINQWLTLSAVNPIPNETLDALNENLKFRSTILGEKFSIADVVVYARIKDQVASWTDEQRTGEKGWRNVVRWVDFVQNTPELGLEIPEEEKVAVDASKVLVYLKPEEAVKEKKKEGEEVAKPSKGRAGAAEKKNSEKGKPDAEAPAAAAATAVEGKGKKDKKDKKDKPKREAPKKEEPVLSPSQIDLRVGHILYCRPHPNADSLFVSTIAMGDAADSPLVTPHNEITDLPESVLAAHNPLPPVRTVCSGLNGLVPLEEMQNRKVVVVANLKPVTMRGIKSSAMVLAASPQPKEGEETDHKKELVELVAPPAIANAGDKVFFEGYEGTPEPVLNPKKKVWESIQPGFSTNGDLQVVFERKRAGWVGDAEAGKAKGNGESGKLVVATGGVCKVASLVGSVVR